LGHAESTLKELAEKEQKLLFCPSRQKRRSRLHTVKRTREILGKSSSASKIHRRLVRRKSQSSNQRPQGGEILVLENVRSWDKETKSATPEEASKTELVQNLAPLADLLLTTLCRSSSWTHQHGWLHRGLPSAAGRIMERELKSLSKALENQKTICLRDGWGKSRRQLEISKYVLGKGIADYVLTGGVTGQLFLAAKGADLGKGNMAYLERRTTGLIPGIKA
jgi:phosphoglycerate kinase